MFICIHCNRLKRHIHSSGLCRRCKRERSIRALYPPITDEGDMLDEGDLMTEEEVESLVSEQMLNPPEWWWDENPSI